MLFNHEENLYELDVPQRLEVQTEHGVYEIVVNSIIKEETNLFNCVTSYEDYDYVLEQFVKNLRHIFDSPIKVLVLYYDQEQEWHATIMLYVSVIKIGDV